MKGFGLKIQPFSNRLERRVVLAFLLFTLVPLTVLGFFGVREVEQHALQRAQVQLEITTAHYADELLGRLKVIETQLQLMLELNPDVKAWASRVPEVKSVQVSADLTGSTQRSAISFDAGAFWLGIPHSRHRVWFRLDLERLWHDLGESRDGGRTCVYIGDIEHHCGDENTQIPVPRSP